MTTQTNNQQTTDLLNEIFLTPSNETKENRFSADNQATAASCSGNCKGNNGGCVSSVAS